MKAVILAAGKGTRIHEVTHGQPKCLLSFGELTILDWQIQGLLSAGISKVAIVVGHSADRVINHIELNYADRLETFHFVHNPDYDMTNNIYSLWLARDWLRRSDFLCLNADVLCHPGILATAAECRGPVSMVIDPAWRDETMKVVIREGQVLRMSKGVTRTDFSGTYIGITRFSREITPAIFAQIGSMIAEGRVHDFFNAAVQRLVDRGLLVRASYTRGLPWAEIDDPADYQFARKSVYPRLPPAITFEPVAAVA